MLRQSNLRERFVLRLSPLLDMALSLVVFRDPERFPEPGSWAGRVRKRLPAGLLDQLQAHAESVDLFALLLEGDKLDLPVPEALDRLGRQDAGLAPLINYLLEYWDALAPEVGAHAGTMARRLDADRQRVATLGPVAFLCTLSDRVSVAGDGDTLVLHWGGGMRLPLLELDQIVLVPSAFCPRRLMFYRAGPVQIFFYSAVGHESDPAAEPADPPERLTLGFAALADTTRLKLLRLIAREQLPAQEMAARLSLAESTVSRHLRVLLEAGMIQRSRQDGRYVIYGLNAKRPEELMRLARTYLGGALDG